ncbi:MAG: M28 family peptidase [candidate division KSB1 bacterium]|nr:M28 family peptidase [candidate division KSB1 bacterium]
MPNRSSIKTVRSFCAIGISLWSFACSEPPRPIVSPQPLPLKFSGERALAIETEFVSRFPYRSSGMPNNRRAAQWIQAWFDSLGWRTYLQKWQIINYSRPVALQNVVCELPGRSDRKILVVAHHDQSPATIQGADNDGSGIAIMLHLAEIFSAEGPPEHTLIFVSTDAEEYGMIGTKHYLDTADDHETIIAGISLDNLGKRFYNGIGMSPVGQFRGYGALWLQLLAREAAQKHPGLWVPQLRPALFQILDQAVPVSFMDQGPMVAAGIPALGFRGITPPEWLEMRWKTYHSPEDLLKYQSAETLQQAGAVTEVLIRDLLRRRDFPPAHGPYLYFDASGTWLTGAPLWALFVILVALYFIAAFARSGGVSRSTFAAWRQFAPHFLAWWLPLVAGIVLLYGLVAIGLMDRYHLYPATSKDPALFHPRWPAVILFLLSLAMLLILAHRLRRRWAPGTLQVNTGQRVGFGMSVVGLAAVYVLLINPFSLLLMLPTLAWAWIGRRRGPTGIVDALLFLAGGAMLYLLIYFFGFVILRNDFAILWYVMMMFSIGMIAFPTALAITAILAAGLAMMFGREA